VATREGGLDVREILPHPAEGEKCLLTSPSIGLPIMRLLGSFGLARLDPVALASAVSDNRLGERSGPVRCGSSSEVGVQALQCSPSWVGKINAGEDARARLKLRIK
jgi:hypothetical protein